MQEPKIDLHPESLLPLIDIFKVSIFHIVTFEVEGTAFLFSSNLLGLLILFKSALKKMIAEINDETG
jgi:hypothetical protein